MSENSLKAFDLFKENPKLFALYSAGIANQARVSMHQISVDSEFQQIFATVIRYLILVELQFNETFRSQLTRLAMQEAITGENPRILLSFLPDGNLADVSEIDIKSAIVNQLTDNGPLNQLLERNVIKFTFNL
ncbi:hypothetical protein [Microcystis sp. M145S2]|jgi:hypothetical protein|uniref:hypothetical protein n=1 Tax=Microcystis sp. M145S2 TaxID=2771148 RepID=UPI00258E7517|nr:hypothetical protein [Microcystis sp. M145S2]MCA2761223.1 hypothetical protein [Microcystis sp. M145S2]